MKVNRGTMKKTLRERYEEKQQEKMLSEAFSDYFKSGSDNIKKFNSTIQQLKNIAQKNNLPSLQTAVANAEKQFESVVISQQQGQKPDATKSQLISKATAFVGIMSQFFTTFKNITAQLSSVKAALANANNENGKSLKDLLGNDAEKFGQLITTQIQKSGGGILNTVKRFLSGGGTDNPAQIMQQFGLDANQLTNELLALTPQQMTSFIQQTSGIQPFKFSAPAGEQPNGTKPAEQTISAAGTQNTTSSQPTQETKPAQASTTTTGASEKPTPDKAQQRDVAIQRAVKNRNAFNTQQLSALSNEEVANDLKAIANSLGIKL